MDKLTATSFFIEIEDISEAAKSDLSLCRYNGGWAKTITGINRKKTNGYSLIGSFVENAKEGAYRVNTNKLYLDCDIQGSRKSQDKYYTLFTISSDGKIEVLYQSPDGGDNKSSWVIKIWDICEEYLNKKIEKSGVIQKKEALKDFSSSDLYNELVARGFEVTINKPDEDKESGRFGKIELE